ncbi:hypothetical protein L1987_21023 [Smallanthus sonchifolius]|uniref:Uncharacterized protein n=1 Tax=Smallanthus sonchifolius TaxID=185202 RepID=A0ACB9IWB3_9ASTR|nr:hypothetical protein L1987_21023 [Smallanthus sonchifolius]
MCRNPIPIQPLEEHAMVAVDMSRVCAKKELLDQIYDLSAEDGIEGLKSLLQVKAEDEDEGIGGGDSEHGA